MRASCLVPEHSVSSDRNPCLLVVPLHSPGLALPPWGRLFDASLGRHGFKRCPTPLHPEVRPASLLRSFAHTSDCLTSVLSSLRGSFPCSLNPELPWAQACICNGGRPVLLRTGLAVRCQRAGPALPCPPGRGCHRGRAARGPHLPAAQSLSFSRTAVLCRSPSAPWSETPAHPSAPAGGPGRGVSAPVTIRQAELEEGKWEEAPG